MKNRKKAFKYGEYEMRQIYRYILFFPYALTVCGLARIFFDTAKFGFFMPFLLSFPFAVLGGLLQHFYMKIFRGDDESDNILRDTLPCLLCGALISLGVGALFAKFIVLAPVHAYSYTFYIIFGALCPFIAFICGGLIFTLPSEDFISPRSSYIFIALIILLLLLSSLFNVSISFYLILASLTFFTAFFIGKAQENIANVSRGSRVFGTISDSRAFALKASLIFLCAIPLIFVPVAAIINGLWISVKGLMMLVGFYLSSDETDTSMTEERLTDILFSEAVFSNVGLNKFFFVLFWILLGGFIIFLIFRKKFVLPKIRFSLRAIINFFKELWRRILERLLAIRFLGADVTESKEELPFTDEIFDYSAVSGEIIEGESSEARFTQHLEGLTTPAEKFRYAYSVLAGQFSKMGISPSLTPREMCDGLTKTGRYSLDGISEIYEIICYAEKIPPRASCERELARICYFVRSNFEK